MSEKTIHPADAAQNALIPSANSFKISLFLGTGRYAKRDAPTLAQARSHALQLAGIHGAPSGRKPMIYAVLPDGRDVLVPDNYEPSAETEAKPEAPANPADTAAKKPWDHLVGRSRKRARENAEAKEQAMTTTKSASKTTGKGKSESKKAPVTSKAAKTDSISLKAPIAGTKPAKGKTPPKKPAAKTRIVPKAAKLGQRAAIEAAAREGMLPKAPDFSAETHKRFRPKLEEVVKMVKAGDVKGLKALEINPVSTSPKAIARYRDLAVVALEAKKKAA